MPGLWEGRVISAERVLFKGFTEKMMKMCRRSSEKLVFCPFGLKTAEQMRCWRPDGRVLTISHDHQPCLITASPNVTTNHSLSTSTSASSKVSTVRDF